MLQKLKLPLLAILNLWLFGVRTQSMPPEIEWRTHLDGPYGDWVKSLERTGVDYIITGEVYTADTGSAVDILLAKVDVKGRVTWKRYFDAGLGRADTGFRARQTQDGGYIIVGTSFQQTEAGSNSRAYIVKTDREGQVVWDKLYDSSYFWVGRDVLERPEGFMILGQKELGPQLRAQVVLLALGVNGEVLWEKVYGGSGRDLAYRMRETEDGYIVVGQTASYPDEVREEHVYLLKVDKEGDLIWEKTLPPPAFDARDIRPTPDGGFYITGCAIVPVNGVNDGQACLIKVTDSGEEVWSAITGGPGGDGAFDLTVTPDGGAIMAGYSETEPGFTACYLVKANSGGKIEWEMTLENTGEAEGIQLMPDGGYLITGVAGPTNPNDVRDDSSIFFIKLKPEDLPAYRFIRGDANRDSEVDLSDAVALLRYLFLGDRTIPCPDAGDTNDDGVLNISDSVYLVNHLFKSGPAILSPFPEEGVDLTPDELGCAQ